MASNVVIWVIKLTSSDQGLLQKAFELIKKVADENKVPYSVTPLPTKNVIFAVQRSPKYYGRSKDLFVQKTYVCNIQLKLTPKQSIVELFSTVTLPSGVNPSHKLLSS